MSISAFLCISSRKSLRECLKQWAHEVHDMSWVVWKALFVKLPAVETEDKQTQGTFEGIWAARKTTGFASETGQVMRQFGIVSFHRVGIRLAFRNFISAKVIPEPLVSIKAIRVIPFRFGCSIHNLLQSSLRADPDHSPSQNTASFAVYQSDNIDFVFLSPMKVNISSNSASFTSRGSGALGKASATSVTQ